MATRDPDPTRTAGTRPVDLTVTTQTRPDMLDSGDPITLDDVEAGQRIDDFDLLTALGTGAFGRVFLARQQSMQRLVAV